MSSKHKDMFFNIQNLCNFVVTNTPAHKERVELTRSLTFSFLSQRKNKSSSPTWGRKKPCECNELRIQEGELTLYLSSLIAQSFSTSPRERIECSMSISGGKYFIPSPRGRAREGVKLC